MERVEPDRKLPGRAICTATWKRLSISFPSASGNLSTARFRGCSYREIAGALGIPAGTVTSRPDALARPHEIYREDQCHEPISPEEISALLEAADARGLKKFGVRRSRTSNCDEPTKDGREGERLSSFVPRASSSRTHRCEHPAGPGIADLPDSIWPVGRSHPGEGSSLRSWHSAPGIGIGIFHRLAALSIPPGLASRRVASRAWTRGSTPS